MIFENTNIPLLGKALDAYALRQKALASNIANLTTPGYKSQSVSFEDQLAKASNGSSLGSGPESIEGIEPRVYETSEDEREGYNPMASGFNDVDIDFEMAELAKNQIRFKMGSRLLSEAFKGMQKAIRGSL